MSSDGALYVMEKPFEDQEIMIASDLYKTLTNQVYIKGLICIRIIRTHRMIELPFLSNGFMFPHPLISCKCVQRMSPWKKKQSMVGLM